jgi:hypothetical protein
VVFKYTLATEMAPKAGNLQHNTSLAHPQALAHLLSHPASILNFIGMETVATVGSGMPPAEFRADRAKNINHREEKWLVSRDSSEYQQLHVLQT